MGIEDLIKVLLQELRSIVGHSSIMVDSSHLQSNLSFPFEALFVHLIKEKKPLDFRCSFFLFVRLLFRRLRKTTSSSVAKGWLDQPPQESTQVRKHTFCTQ